MQNRFFSISLWASLAALAAWSGLAADWPINQWSVAYLGQRLDKNSFNLDNSTAPENHPRARIWLAEDVMKRGECEAALAILQPHITPTNHFAFSLLGDIHKMCGNFTQAVKIWGQARDYQALTQAAEQADTDGLVDDAEIAYQGLWEFYPEKGALPFANFLWDQENYSAAENVLRYALGRYPYAKESSLWKYRLGDFLRFQDRWDEAFLLFHEMLAENNDDWKAHIALGWIIYESTSDYEATLAEFQKAIAIAPQNGEGYIAIGQIMANEKIYSEAGTWLTTAVKLNPENKWWWLSRANTTLTAGDIDKALIQYEETITRFPNWAPGYYEMAWAYKLANQQKNALQTIDQAISLQQPPNGWYYFRAGLIFEWAGLDTDARSAYQIALKLLPENESITTSLYRMQNTNMDK